MANGLLDPLNPLQGLGNVPGVTDLTGSESYVTTQGLTGAITNLADAAAKRQNIPLALGRTGLGFVSGRQQGMTDLANMQKLRQDLIKGGLDVTKTGLDIQTSQFDLGQKQNKQAALFKMIQNLTPEQQMQAVSNPEEFTKTMIGNLGYTNNYKDYLFAKQGGYPGSYTDYTKDIEKYRATNVSATVKMPEKEKMMLESDIKTLDSLVSASNAARSIATKTQDIDAILGDIPGGGVVKLGADLQAYLGLPTEQAQKSQIVQAIATKGATEIRAPGSGSTSDLEFNAYRTAFPSLATTAQGRKLMVRMANASAARASKLTDWARTRMQEGKFSYEGLREYDESLGKVITDDLKKSLDAELQKTGKTVNQYDYSTADALVGIGQ